MFEFCWPLQSQSYIKKHSQRIFLPRTIIAPKYVIFAEPAILALLKIFADCFNFIYKTRGDGPIINDPHFLTSNLLKLTLIFTKKAELDTLITGTLKKEKECNFVTSFSEVLWAINQSTFTDSFWVNVESVRPLHRKTENQHTSLQFVLAVSNEKRN